MTETHLTIAEAARLVGTSTATIRNWERHGLIVPSRTNSGRRQFTQADVATLREIRDLRSEDQVGLVGIRRRLNGKEAKDGSPRGAPEPTSGVPAWAQSLRRLRQEQELSLRDVYRRTKLSPSFVSSIERGVANPSLAALQKLTAAYGTSIVQLMSNDEADARTLVRPADRRIYDATPGVLLEQLNFGPHQMELHLFRVEPGVGTGEAFQHDGEEFIMLIEGTLDVWLDQVERYRLTAGDVLYFESQRLHEWVNPGEIVTVFLGVNTPPTF